MAYDSELEKRLDALVANRQDFHKQKMFGGLGYLLRGNMCFCIWKDGIILRIGEEQAAGALQKKHVIPFDITGRPMKGWVIVESKGISTQDSLKNWVAIAIDFVVKLPRK